MTNELVRFLVLGRAVDARGLLVSIKVHPAAIGTRLDIAMDGPPMASVGGQFPVLRVIGVDGQLAGFADAFQAVDAQWLVPYLARLADGEDVAEAELVAAYVGQHGSEPEIEMLPITV